MEPTAELETVRDALDIGPAGVGCCEEPPDVPVPEEVVLAEPQPESRVAAVAASAVWIAWRRVRSRGEEYMR